MVYEQIMNLVNVVLLLAYVCFTFGSCVMMFTLKQSNLLSQSSGLTHVFTLKSLCIYTPTHICICASRICPLYSAICTNDDHCDYHTRLLG